MTAQTQPPPAQMTAVTVPSPGGPENLTLSQVAVPEPGPGDILIQVAASGMNRADILQRRGHYPPPPGVTDIPGLEVSGIIAAVGRGVDPKHVGRAVCALLPGGGYAEYVTAPMDLCLAVPPSLSLIDAAGLPEALFTVWQTIFTAGGLKKGDHVLVHGGSSGIGTMAIQMIRAAGARATVTAGSDEKCGICKNLGAAAINYKTQDFTQNLKDDPVDIVLDMIGGDYVARNISVMGPRGRHISIAYQAGAKAEIPIPALMQKKLTLMGSTLRALPLPEKTALARTLTAQAWPWVATGIVRPVIHDDYPLAKVQDAHKAFERGEHVGKILLIVNEKLGKAA